MRLLRRHSLMIVIVVVGGGVVVGHFKSFHPQKPRFSLSERNTGPTDGRTDTASFGDA